MMPETIIRQIEWRRADVAWCTLIRRTLHGDANFQRWIGGRRHEIQ